MCTKWQYFFYIKFLNLLSITNCVTLFQVLISFRKSKISVLRYWLSGHFLLIGYENGTFRMVDIRDFSTLSSWTQGLNDPSTGVMTDIMHFKVMILIILMIIMMHFKEFIITSGADGTLFTQKLSQKILQLANSGGLI